MSQGWKLKDIEEMDIQLFMKLRAHEIQKVEKPKTAFIDQIGIF